MKRSRIVKKCFLNKGIDREFLCFNYKVQYKEKMGSNYILYCICKEKKYAEIVFENAKGFENQELIYCKEIMFIESISVRKEKIREYTIIYQDTQEITKVYAQNMTIYQSSYFICEASRYAIAEWIKGFTCFPSVIVAMLLLTGKENTISISLLKQQIQECIDTCNTWKFNVEANKGQIHKWGQEHYLLAAQCFSEAVSWPTEEDLNALLVGKIEMNKLMRFDP